MGKGLPDCFFRDLVEHHAFDPAFVDVSSRDQVPGDGLSFAVRVRGEVDFLGLGGSLLDLFHHLALFVGDPVVWFEIIFDID